MQLIKHALAYIRVSTEGQVTDGISIEAQKHRIHAYSQAQGFEIIGWYSDAGLSEKTMERPQLQAALEILRTGDADCLVVLKLDRLSRSTKDILELADRCQKESWSLVSLCENLDTSSAAGRFVLSVLGSLAQLEREQTAERTRMALKHLRQTGRRVGEIRYGYDLAPDGKTLVVNTSEQATLNKIRLFRERKNASYQTIANIFNAVGIPAKQGGKWSKKVVWSIYKGLIA